MLWCTDTPWSTHLHHSGKVIGKTTDSQQKHLQLLFSCSFFFRVTELKVSAEYAKISLIIAYSKKQTTNALRLHNYTGRSTLTKVVGLQNVPLLFFQISKLPIRSIIKYIWAGGAPKKIFRIDFRTSFKSQSLTSNVPLKLFKKKKMDFVQGQSGSSHWDKTHNWGTNRTYTGAPGV